jgi:nitrogenase subunit NifH
MKTTKHLGIWMDHSSAHLMDATSEPIVSKKIESEFTRQEKERTLDKGEHMMHNAEQQKQHAYYKKLGDAIKNYDQVVVFGPTKAKDELMNILKADRHFENIKIEVKHADKMTENQQHAFVKDYFKNSVYSWKVV